MAGIYKQYTLSVKIPFLVQYVCEKCGANNTAIHYVKASSAYTDRGTFRQKVIEQRREEAIIQLKENKKNLTVKIIDEIRRKNYHTLHLACRCSKCSHIPVWAYPKWLPIATSFAYLSAFISFFVFLFMCLVCIGSGSFSWMLILILLISAAPAAVYYIGMFAYENWQDKQVEQLDQHYLPIFQMLDRN